MTLSRSAELNGLPNTTLLVVFENQGTESWKLIVAGVFEFGGGAGEVEAQIGAFTINAPGVDESHTRAVALAVAPSVGKWRVHATSAASSSNMQIRLASGLPNSESTIDGLVIPLTPDTPSGSTNQPRSLLWVATNGTTGERGNIDKPFPTVSAALAAAQDHDSVLVSSGTYVENIVVPPALTGITIEGLGDPSEVVIAPTSGSALVWSASAGKNLTLQNIKTQGTGPGSFGIHATGAGSEAVGNLRVLNCRASVVGESTEYPFRADQIGTVALGLLASVAVLDNCGQAVITNAPGSEDDQLQEVLLNVTFDSTVTHAGYYFQGFQSPTCLVHFTGRSRVVGDGGCDVQMLATDGETMPTAGRLRWNGHVGVDGVGVATQNSPVGAIDLSGAVIDGPYAHQHTGSSAGCTVAAFGTQFRGGLNLQNDGTTNLVIDNRGGWFARLGSSYEQRCFVDRLTGAQSGFSIPQNASVLYSFGVELTDPPFPPGTQVTYNIEQLRSNVAADVSDILFGFNPTNTSIQITNFNTTTAAPFRLSWNRAG